MLKQTEAAANALLATSAGATGTAWWLILERVNVVLATIAALVAIASGIYSIYIKWKAKDEIDRRD